MVIGADENQIALGCKRSTRIWIWIVVEQKNMSFEFPLEKTNWCETVVLAAMFGLCFFPWPGSIVQSSMSIDALAALGASRKTKLFARWARSHNDSEEISLLLYMYRRSTKH